MPALSCEDLARFLAAWKRAYLPMGLVTPAVTNTISVLEELASGPGVLVVDEAERLQRADGEAPVDIGPALAAPEGTPYTNAAPDDDIPF